MGHKNSKKSTDKSELKKSSRDIRLLIPDENGTIQTVVVPKSLLLEHSSVFKEMVDSGKLKKLKKINLEGVHVIGVLRLMQYVENGEVTFEKVSEVAETLKVAEKYKIEGIEDVCIEHMYNSLDADNVCEIYELCVQKAFIDVIYKCLQVIDQETESVLKSDGFVNLKLSTVQDIISRSSLSVEEETTIYNAVLKWGEAEFTRKNGDKHSDSTDMNKLIKPLLACVRFQNMSSKELDDLKQNGLHIIQHLNLENNQAVQPRHFIKSYIHHFDIFDSPQPSIANGESFHLSIEILKGKVYFCGVNLALKQFSARMNASCLYAMLCGTNKRNSEQKKVRSTFLNINDESSLRFSTPLYLKDNDILEIQLNVKMAGNVSPLSRKNDTEIIIPDSKDIAMKVLPLDSTQSIVKCIFKDILYYF